MYQRTQIQKYLLTLINNVNLLFFYNYIKKHQKTSMEQSLIAERFLSKSKKYYSYKIKEKDKENIIEGDIKSIIQKLSECRGLPKISHSCRITTKKKSYIPFLKQNSTVIDANKLGVNSIDFFEKEQYNFMKKKDLKKDVLHYINKIRVPTKNKCSLYQEYLKLAEETNDYLEYYLTNFAGEDSGRASQLLKEEGKTIILLILRKKYKCFETNSVDISNRILLTFKLNPMNDFVFISWEKFMKIRKLISGDFNRRDCNEFILQYFFVGAEKTITSVQFWSIFNSVIRKLAPVLDSCSLDVLICRIMEDGKMLIPEEELLTKDKLRKIIFDDPMFIWHEFVTLTFV